MFCCSSTICHSTHSLCATVTLSLYLPLLLYNLFVAPMLFSCANSFLLSSFCITISRSFSHSLSHFLFIMVTLSVSSFPLFSSHTIPLLFSMQVRSFTGCPFSYEVDEDNQMAKDHTIAYGIWKTNPSYIHLQSRYLTQFMHLFLDIPPTHFRSFSLIVSLPLSFSFDTSPKLSSYIPLSNNYYLSLSIYISLLLSVSLLFCYCFSISPSLTYFQSLWRNLWL